MISVRALFGSFIAAIFSGAVGFASAWFLQKQASQERMRELAHKEKLESQRAEEERQHARQADRERRAFELKGMWASEPLIAYKRIARQVLERHRGLSYVALKESVDVTEPEIEALDHVLIFWNDVADLIEADLLDLELAGQLLGPDADGWLANMPMIAQGIDMENPNAAHGHVLIAQTALRRLSAHSVSSDGTRRIRRGQRLPGQQHD